MSTVIIATWICTIISLYGTYLNIKQSRNGFICWGIANIFWIWYNVTTGTFALAVQFAIYFFLALIGYRSWKNTNLLDENQKLRSALDRIHYITKENCSDCVATGNECDGCLTKARINFIDTVLHHK